VPPQEIYGSSPSACFSGRNSRLSGAKCRTREFGFDVADLRVDMARVMACKDASVAKSREGVEAWMRGLKGTEVIVLL